MQYYYKISSKIDEIKKYLLYLDSIESYLKQWKNTADESSSLVSYPFPILIFYFAKH